MEESGAELQKSLNSSNELDQEKYCLFLFVIGASPNSIRAVSNMKSFCEKHLKNRYTLEIVDVYQQPNVAEQEEIIALPLLIKKSPGAERRLIGDMSDEIKVLKGLGIK